MSMLDLCRNCGGSFPRSTGPGRPSCYCSSHCRREARAARDRGYGARHRAERRTLLELVELLARRAG
jgi:hypothetical protein